MLMMHHIILLELVGLLGGQLQNHAEVVWEAIVDVICALSRQSSQAIMCIKAQLGELSLLVSSRPAVMRGVQASGLQGMSRCRSAVSCSLNVPVVLQSV